MENWQHTTHIHCIPFGRMARSAHKSIVHDAKPDTILCTDVIGPIYLTAANGER